MDTDQLRIKARGYIYGVFDGSLSVIGTIRRDQDLFCDHLPFCSFSKFARFLKRSSTIFSFSLKLSSSAKVDGSSSWLYSRFPGSSMSRDRNFPSSFPFLYVAFSLALPFL